MPCVCGDSSCPCGIPCYCNGSCNCSNCAIALLHRCRLCDKPLGSVERNGCSCFLRDSQIPKSKLICDEFHQNWRNAMSDASYTLDTNWVPLCRVQDTSQRNCNAPNESQIGLTGYGMNGLSLHANLESTQYSCTGNGTSSNDEGFYNASPVFTYGSAAYNSPNYMCYDSFNFGYDEMNSAYPNWDESYGYFYGRDMVDHGTDEFLSNLENRHDFNVDHEDMDTSSTSSMSSSDGSVTVVIADFASDLNLGARQKECDVQNDERPNTATLREILPSSESEVGRIYNNPEEVIATNRPERKVSNSCSNTSEAQITAEERERLSDQSANERNKNPKCDDANSDAVALSGSISPNREQTLNVPTVESDTPALRSMEGTSNTNPEDSPKSEEPQPEAETIDDEDADDWFLYIKEWIQNVPKK